MNHELVKYVATKVRRWAEHIGRKQGFAEDLECFCGIAAAKLFVELHAAGVEDAKIVSNDCHAFVEIENFILDVTATQFGEAPVVILRRTEKVPYWWDNSRSKTFTCVHEFRKWQLRGWPGEQVVYKELLP